MKQCPNCGGVLDDKGKCLACGTVTELKLSSEDGVVITTPKTFQEEWWKIIREVFDSTPKDDKAWEDYIETINQEPIPKTLKEIVAGFNSAMTPEEKKKIIDEFVDTPSVYPVPYEECLKAMDNINRIKREAKL